MRLEWVPERSFAGRKFPSLTLLTGRPAGPPLGNRSQGCSRRAARPASTLLKIMVDPSAPASTRLRAADSVLDHGAFPERHIARFPGSLPTSKRPVLTRSSNH